MESRDESKGVKAPEASAYHAPDSQGPPTEQVVPRTPPVWQPTDASAAGTVGTGAGAIGPGVAAPSIRRLGGAGNVITTSPVSETGLPVLRAGIPFASAVPMVYAPGIGTATSGSVAQAGMADTILPPDPTSVRGQEARRPSALVPQGSGIGVEDGTMAPPDSGVAPLMLQEGSTKITIRVQRWSLQVVLVGAGLPNKPKKGDHKKYGPKGATPLSEKMIPGTSSMIVEYEIRRKKATATVLWLITLHLTQIIVFDKNDLKKLKEVTDKLTSEWKAEGHAFYTSAVIVGHSTGPGGQLNDSHDNPLLRQDWEALSGLFGKSKTVAFGCFGSASPWAKENAWTSSGYVPFGTREDTLEYAVKFLDNAALGSSGGTDPHDPSGLSPGQNYGVIEFNFESSQGLNWGLGYGKRIPVVPLRPPQ